VEDGVSGAPFTRHFGKVAALPRANVDTDQIIPKQFLKRVERDGFGEFLFYDWRQDAGFELNQPEAQGATILLAGTNFGCGSSREHAVWALREYGFRAILAPSFADIFYSNCCENGVLAVRLPEPAMAQLFQRHAATPGYSLTVDLVTRFIDDKRGFQVPFTIAPYHRELLLQGLDPISRTLREEARIRDYETRRAS
jgi:3-isopropylmalate/(R)-2-methylmalate dehydratase small subunit